MTTSPTHLNAYDEMFTLCGLDINTFEILITSSVTHRLSVMYISTYLDNSDLFTEERKNTCQTCIDRIPFAMLIEEDL